MSAADPRMRIPVRVELEPETFRVLHAEAEKRGVLVADLLAARARGLVRAGTYQPNTRRRLTQAEVDAIYRMADRGVNQSRIADTLSITHKAVSYRLRRRAEGKA
jgi:hypothetical protein